MPASGAAANGHHHPHPHPSPFTATALAGHHPHHPFNYSFHSDASCPECRQLERSPRAPVASYFDEAFRTSPSPPPTSFLANILNPADASPPPADRRARVLPRSPTPTWASCASRVHASMPPTRQQTGRLPNGYVDLTTASPPAPDAAAERAPRRPKRKSPTPGPSTKRQKRDDGAAIRRPKKEPEADIEEIDLSDDKGDFLEVLQKQRAEAVKAQQRPEEKATTFNSFTCVICMDTPTDLTATSCGHLFCHTCLMEALIAGENRSAPNEPKRSQCPVCRKFISRHRSADIIPLLLMKKGLATQPRKSTVPAPENNHRPTARTPRVTSKKTAYGQ